MLTQRQVKIIESLRTSNSYVKGSELAQWLDVSTRTIRNDVAAINSVLGETILGDRVKGYYLISTYVAKERTSQSEPSDRIVVILLALLDHETVDLYELAEMLYVSERTIEQDCLQIKFWMEKCYQDKLRLEKKGPSYFLEGSFARNRILFELTKQMQVQQDIMQLQRYFPNHDFDSLRECLLACVAACDISTRYISLSRMQMELAMMLARDGNRYDLWSEVPKIHPFVMELKQQLAQYEWQLSEEQCRYLSFMVEKSLELDALEQAIRDNPKVDPIRYELVYRAVSKTLAGMQMNLVDVQPYLDDLILHILVSISRMERGITLSNPLHNALRNDHPFIFTTAMQLCKVVEDACNVSFEVNEWSYVVAYLAMLFYKVRKQDKQAQLHIWVVIPYNKTMLNYIGDAVASFCNLDTMVVHKAHQMSKQEVAQANLIITTSSIDVGAMTTMIQIQPSFSIVDKIKVKEALERVVLQQKRLLFFDLMHRYFDPNLFVILPQAKHKHEVIAQLCSRLHSFGCVDETFYEDVCTRDALVSTALESGVALPHALQFSAVESKIAIAVLSTPLHWDENRIRVVLLGAYSEADQEHLQQFMDLLAQILVLPHFVERVKHSKNFHDFMYVMETMYLET
ncbi:MAG: BglG family transcription antiterminator [Erysipelotrichaceae bacterium]